MLLRPEEESTEIETYLNPLFTQYPDIFLQPVVGADLDEDSRGQQP